MTIAIHLPTWWPWALACLGCFVAGVVVGMIIVGNAIGGALGRGLGW